VVVPETGAEGVIFAQGGITGGFSFYARGGTVTLYIDGQNAGSGRIDRKEPFAFSADETVDAGMEAGSPVSPDFGPKGNAFPGGQRRIGGSGQLAADEPLIFTENDLVRPHLDQRQYHHML